jgi:hypothetical protein
MAEAERCLDAFREIPVLHCLKNRIGVRLLAGVLTLAIAPAFTLAAARAESDTLVRDTGPDQGAYAQAQAAYANAVEPPTSAPALKTNSKAKQTASGRKGASKEAGLPFIEFRSRYALSYGHTFVVFGRLNAKGEVGEIKPEMVAGLHPAGAGSELWTIGHVVFVPAETGWSDGDLEEEYVSNRFRVVLSEEQYAKLVAHIRQKQANSKMWHAALYNCNLWTGQIAEHLGLKTGFHWLPPAEYIQKIKEMNAAAVQEMNAAVVQGRTADASPKTTGSTLTR